MKKHIFTIMAGCAPVGNIMLESFMKNHPDEYIHAYLFWDDTNQLTVKNEQLTIHLLPESLKEDFLSGHKGTAKVWSRVITQNPDTYLIQIDSDVVFKKESISLIEKAGYPDIYGSRRCYQNNPGKAPVYPGTEDAVSTYFLGFNPAFLGSIIKVMDYVSINNLERMIQGVYNPLGFPCLDFFDPCFFYMRSQGASVYFEEQDIIGGQNFLGEKKSAYPSNMHLDMGSHLCHFGGAGSGCFASMQLTMNNGQLTIEKGYKEWAIERWRFFEDLFMRKDSLYASEIYPNIYKTKFDESGRWVSGPYDKQIWDQVKEDLNEINL